LQIDGNLELRLEVLELLLLGRQKQAVVVKTKLAKRNSVARLLGFSGKLFQLFK
jgi:hypothetical protein